MRPPTRAAVLVLVTLVAVLAGGTGPAVAADAAPLGFVATPSAGPPGTPTLIQGTGWPTGSQISISSCGNNALNGDADCDTKGAVTATANADGAFTVRTSLTAPPKPCPCVLFAHSVEGTTTVRFPVDITGQPTATPVEAGGTRSLQIDSDIEGSGPVQSYFGWPADRELVLTVTNTGTFGVDNPPTSVALGKGDDPTDLLTQVQLGSIAPGQTVVVRVPFQLPALSFGAYTAKTTVQGMDTPAEARSTTSTYPWGLVIVAWLLLQIPLLGLHRRRAAGDTDQSGLLDLNDPFADLAGAAAATGGDGRVTVPAWAAGAVGLPVAASAAAAPDPALSGMPAWASAAVGAPAAAAVLDPRAATTTDAPSAVAAVAALIPGAAREPAPAAAAGPPGRYGIGHLRRFVDPARVGRPPAAVPAPRVVVGRARPTNPAPGPSAIAPDE